MIYDEFLDSLVMMGVVLSFMSLCIFTEFFGLTTETSKEEKAYREETLQLQRDILKELRELNGKN